MLWRLVMVFRGGSCTQNTDGEGDLLVLAGVVDGGEAGLAQDVQAEVAVSLCPFVALLGQDGHDQAASTCTSSTATMYNASTVQRSTPTGLN